MSENNAQTLSELDAHQYLFIAGIHRSGTSLIHELLREHPQVSGFKDTPAYMEDEGQFLQSVYPQGTEFGGPGQFAFAADARMTETHPLVSRENAEKLFREWSEYWDLSKPVLVEKSPPNILRSRFLQALFPNSRFLVVLRHPVAVAYATRKWSKTPILSLIDHTLTAYEALFQDLPHIQHSQVIHYEDFVSAPQATLDSMLEFTGLASTPLSKNVSTSINDKYFQEWKKERRWPWYPVPRRVPAELEQRARVFGYHLGDCHRIKD